MYNETAYIKYNNKPQPLISTWHIIDLSFSDFLFTLERKREKENHARSSILFKCVKKKQILYVNIIFCRAGNENYEDSTIGFVELNREDSFCYIRGKVCPEHRVHNKL